MSDPRIDIIRRLARRSNNPALGRTLQKSRAEDIASAFTLLPLASKKTIWDGIQDDDKAAEVLAYMDNQDLLALLDHIGVARISMLLSLIEVDDATDIISELPTDLQKKILSVMEEDDRTQVEDLLAFPEDSAGGLMHLDVLRCSSQNTCRDAINELQNTQNVEMAFYLYIENASQHLVGVISLRALLTHPPSTKLSDIMITDLITVHPETHQEDVAKLVSRYDLLALPVVDHFNRLLGIITVDDVIDVIHETANKNMMLMAGMTEEQDPLNRHVFKAFQQRFTWLLITLFGGIGMAEMIGLFEKSLESNAALAGFIPVILGTGGNVGTQAATIAVRNIATGHLGTGGSMALLFREARVGGLLGLSFALVLGGYVYVTGEPRLAIAIASSITVTFITAAILGMLVPLSLNKINIDPAAATGPFVTTGIDLVAILIYFSTCRIILP